MADRRRDIDRLLERRRSFQAAVAQESFRLEETQEAIENVTKAKVIVNEIALALQQRVHEQFSRVVSRCLSAVFEDPYEFRIVFEQKRGKTEARLTFVRDGVVFDDPLNEVGGGVIDIACLALRLGRVLLLRPRARRMLVLDEPFANVRGEGNRMRTRTMLLRLADDLGVQFVLNTDVLEFRLGTVVELPNQ